MDSAELLTARHLYAPQMGLCIDSFNVILYDLNLEAPTAASFDGSSPGELEAALHQGSAEDLHNFMTLVGYSYHFVLESWGLIAKEGEEQMDVHMVSTSGCCLPTLRVAGEYPDVIKSVFLISPLLNDIPVSALASSIRAHQLTLVNLTERRDWPGYARMLRGLARCAPRGSSYVPSPRCSWTGGLQEARSSFGSTFLGDGWITSVHAA